MAEITYSQQVVGLPGYNATMRLVQGTSGQTMFGPAWSKLELFPLAAAHDFLAPKLKKLATVKDPDEAVELGMEIALGFGIMAVFADRENTEYIRGIEAQVEQRTAAAEQAQAIEDEAEAEATRNTSIDW